MRIGTEMCGVAATSVELASRAPFASQLTFTSRIVLSVDTITETSMTGIWSRILTDAPFGPRHAGIVIVSEQRMFLIAGVASPFGFPELMGDVWYASSDNASESHAS